MGEVVTEIVKGHVDDEFPFLVASLTFELCPEMLNSPFGEVVGTPVLPQPGRALTGDTDSRSDIQLCIVL